MKTVEECVLERRSVRRYERREIEPEKLNFIYEAIRHIATSYNGQQYSVISVTDQSRKEELYEITQQKQIKTCAVFLVFCVDYHKIRIGAERKGIDFPPFTDTLDGLMVGMIDASMAMQTAAIAAEAQGLGCCSVGYARTADPARIAELLRLPQGVFVVCGLTIGYPAEQPDVKPKQPRSLIIHENHYHTENVSGELLDYDQEVSCYNGCRAGMPTSNDWITHIVDYYRMAMQYDQLAYVREQGFNLKK